MGEPICKGCGQKTHPLYVKKYDGYCLDCSNCGVPERDDKIEFLTVAVRQLAGVLLTTGKEPNTPEWLEYRNEIIRDTEAGLDILGIPHNDGAACIRSAIERLK